MGSGVPVSDDFFKQPIPFVNTVHTCIGVLLGVRILGLTVNELL